MIKVNVNGKNRIINPKYITYQTESSFHATYKGYKIEIEEQESGGRYAKVFNPNRHEVLCEMYFDTPEWNSMEMVLGYCIANILSI